jgi:hypothetical protein
MLFTKTCRVAAILLVVTLVLTIVANVYRMFGIDDAMAREVFFKRVFYNNGSILLIGIALGTLADISRSLQFKTG